MSVDFSSTQVTAALGEIYADLQRAGDQRHAVMTAADAVNGNLPLEPLGVEVFPVRGGGMERWTWLRAGEAALEARCQLDGGATTLVVQWHLIRATDWAVIVDSIERACFVQRPNRRLHDALWDLLRPYPCVVGRVATAEADCANRQLQLISVTSRSGGPLPLETLAAHGFYIR